MIKAFLITDPRVFDLVDTEYKFDPSDEHAEMRRKMLTNILFFFNPEVQFIERERQHVNETLMQPNGWADLQENTSAVVMISIGEGKPGHLMELTDCLVDNSLINNLENCL